MEFTKYTASRRPPWLPTTGPGNLNVPPECWGMTLKQWSAFITYCFMCRGTWEELEASENRKTAGYVNLYQICDTFVKPWTKNLGNSIALLMNAERPLKAQVMISHAWGECMFESMVAVLGRASTLGMSLDTAIWFCTFAQYQPGDIEGDCGPGVAAQLALDPFKKVIESKPPYGMIVIHTSKAELYGRLWCVYEVNEAMTNDVAVTASLSMGYLEQLAKEEAVSELTKKKEAPTESQFEEALSSVHVDVANADCWSQSDRQMIRSRIEAAEGYDALNSTIKKFRVGALFPSIGMITDFLSWGEKEIPAELLGGQSMLSLLVLMVKMAATFVGLHCLTCVCEDSEDAMYMKFLVLIARSLLQGVTFEVGPGKYTSNPPGFDPAKRSDDAEFIKKLREDDEALMTVLRDVSHFPQVVGILEMGAGGLFQQLLKQGIHQAVEQCGLNPMDAVKMMFKKFDKNGDGTISAEELTEILVTISQGVITPQACATMFAAADADRNGQLDLDEFIGWLDTGMVKNSTIAA